MKNKSLHPTIIGLFDIAIAIVAVGFIPLDNTYANARNLNLLIILGTIPLGLCNIFILGKRKLIKQSNKTFAYACATFALFSGILVACGLLEQPAEHFFNTPSISIILWAISTYIFILISKYTWPKK
jgi:uncharacterized membrane protein